MCKRLNLVYFSATGGTKKVVNGIAEGISNVCKEYNLTAPDKREEEIYFDSDDLVIFGVPVYAGRVPKFLFDYFSKIRGNDTPAVFVAVYGNRAYEDALLELKDTLEGNGFIGISAAAFIAEHSYTSKVGTNRPNDKDLELARKYGEKIVAKLESMNSVSEASKITVSGNFPYKERLVTPPITPKTSDDCVRCGLCAKKCPTHAIDFVNFKDIDPTKCIRCCSCVKVCPVNAKAIDHEVFNNIRKGLEANFSNVEREPEYFF